MKSIIQIFLTELTWRITLKEFFLLNVCTYNIITQYDFFFFYIYIGLVFNQIKIKTKMRHFSDDLVDDVL